MIASVYGLQVNNKFPPSEYKLIRVKGSRFYHQTGIHARWLDDCLHHIVSQPRQPTVDVCLTPFQVSCVQLLPPSIFLLENGRLQLGQHASRHW